MQLSSLWVESGCIFIIYEIMRIAGAALQREQFLDIIEPPGRTYCGGENKKV